MRQTRILTLLLMATIAPLARAQVTQSEDVTQRFNSGPAFRGGGSGSLEFRGPPVLSSRGLTGGTTGLRNVISANRGNLGGQLGGTLSLPGLTAERSRRDAAVSRIRSRQQAERRQAVRPQATSSFRRRGQSQSHILTLGFEPMADVADRPERQAEIRLILAETLRLFDDTDVDVDIEFKDSSAILTGTVADDRDRRVLERIIAMEPGVREVVNRLEVSPRLGSP